MLNNKIALITGVGTGIGLATAKRYLKEGAKVIGVGDYNKEFDELGENFELVKCDVTNEKDIMELVGHITKKYGVLDILLTICDKEYRGKISEVSGETINQASKHILTAPILLTKNLKDLLAKSTLASVIFDFPVSAFMMDKNYLESIYNMALADYVRQATAQLRPIRVNGVMFGLIKDHFLAKEDEERFAKTEKKETMIPSQRLGTCEDVANLNNFLADELSKFFNSALIPVDGGYYTTNPRSMGNQL
jgi:NAD(P)-dependent dehydrogenase (short-subunit alcohol dehydrogenase family)